MNQKTSVFAVFLSLTVLFSAGQVMAATPLETMLEKAATRSDGEFLIPTLLMAIETEPDAAETLIQKAIAVAPDKAKDILDAVAVERPVIAEVVEVAPGQSVVEEIARYEAIEAAKPLPGFFASEVWNGEISLGGAVLTGNTEELSIVVGGKANRTTKRWEHSLNLVAELSENNDVQTKERVYTDANIRHFRWDRGYIFALADFELDTFSEFDYRVSEAVGVGYRVLNSDRQSWDVEGGPGARHTQFADGDFVNDFVFTMNSRYSLTIRDGLVFTDDLSILVGTGQQTFTNTAGLTAQLYGNLSARFSFFIQHDTGVPVGIDPTDTATRLNFVYGF
ncbi:MAG: DUF481 domain-containing protein [Pseudomonadota bacterium]